LPESHLREYLAKRAGINSQRDFPLLWLLGRDVPGAVVVRHGDGEAISASEEEEPPISCKIENDPAILRFSLAGIQLKFSAVCETGGGLSIPVHGLNGNFILKMPSPIYKNVPENEFSMMTFARAVGINVPDLRLVSLDCVHNLPSEVRGDLGRALSIERCSSVPTNIWQAFRSLPAYACCVSP
jgi:serine/threonine-protein kinase HipA